MFYDDGNVAYVTLPDMHLIYKPCKCALLTMCNFAVAFIVESSPVASVSNLFCIRLESLLFVTDTNLFTCNLYSVVLSLSVSLSVSLSLAKGYRCVHHKTYVTSVIYPCSGESV